MNEQYEIKPMSDVKHGERFHLDLDQIGKRTWVRLGEPWASVPRRNGILVAEAPTNTAYRGTWLPKVCAVDSDQKVIVVNKARK